MSETKQARKLRMEADVLYDTSRSELAALKLQNAGLVEDARWLRAEAAGARRAARAWRAYFVTSAVVCTILAFFLGLVLYKAHNLW